jgi:hypothetical protein
MARCIVLILGPFLTHRDVPQARFVETFELGLEGLIIKNPFCWCAEIACRQPAVAIYGSDAGLKVAPGLQWAIRINQLKSYLGYLNILYSKK